MNNLVISMPEYNEGDILFDFVQNLETMFNDAFFIIVDDKSQTKFQIKLKDKFENKKNFYIIWNEINLGHGISTVKGLKKALELDFEYIISIDGDGQFDVEEIRSCFELLKSNLNIDLIEGARIYRNEPWFRKLISFFTCFLVFSKTLNWPKDANTPLRIYRKHVLGLLLKSVPEKSLIPNLHISKLTRKKKLNYIEFKVRSLPRGGEKELNLSSVTWHQKFKFLPSRRLILFCIKAINEWLFS